MPASAATYYNVLLTLEGDVAQNYFLLRVARCGNRHRDGTVDLRKEQVQLVRSRFEGGIGNELDVARAETELATTEAEAASLAQRRAELENAIAILVGAILPPSSLPRSMRRTSLESAAAGDIPPACRRIAGTPAGRREAERQLASANARIGVAKAAFFPVLR